MINAKSIATLGIGFGVVSIATLGLLYNDVPAEVQVGWNGGTGDRIPRIKLYADDEAILQVIMSFVTRNPNG